MSALPELTEPLSDGVVILRRLTLDDVGAITSGCQDSEIARWTAAFPIPMKSIRPGMNLLHDEFWSHQG